MSLLNLQKLKPSTRQEMLSHWSIFLIVWNMIGLLKIKETLHAMP